MFAVAASSVGLMHLVLARRNKTAPLPPTAGVSNPIAEPVPANRIEQIISEIPRRRIRQQPRHKRFAARP
jgi:hypothetical protein